MKKLTKKQMGGSPKSAASNQTPFIKTERKGEMAESMKPGAKQPKFDASKVSRNGAKIKGADKIGSGTYAPNATLYKKTGGSIKTKKKK